MTTSTVCAFLDRFIQWATEQKSIQAVALVGSYARGTPTEASDVDLVILAHDPEQFLAERTWVRLFGEPLAETLEDYGILKSIRVRCHDDLEVEFGIADLQWPLDAGSLQVISDGMQILFERGQVLGRHL
jgi:predicted nucleotidyltransferase